MFTLTIQCEDKNELMMYAKASDYASFLHEFREKLRSYHKHGLPKNISTSSDAINLVWEDFNKMLNILVTEDY